MLVTTTSTIEGYQIREYKGIIRGIGLRSSVSKQAFLCGLKGFTGGQDKAYTLMCDQSRLKAHDSLIERARELGANAVVGMRYETCDVARGIWITEVVCYGTAVVVEKRP